MVNKKKTALLIAAAMLCMTAASGCKSSNREYAKVQWYAPITAVNENNDEVFGKASQMTKDKLGIELEIVPLDFGDYDSKMQVLNASGEEFDLVFTSNWLNDYYTNVNKGTLTELDELLEKTPDLKKSIPDYIWDACKVGGKIYGVPNQQIMARATCFLAPTQNIKSMGLDIDKYASLEELNDYKTTTGMIEEYLKKASSQSGTYVKFSSMWEDDGMRIFGLDQVTGSNLPGAVYCFGDDPYKLVNQYETEEFKYYINKRRDWVKQGLIQPQKEDKRPLGDYKGEGKIYPLLGRTATYKPGIEAEASASENLDEFVLIKTKALLNSVGCTATLNAVSATSKNPEAALKIIEFMNINADFHNLLSFGIEGKNYNKTKGNYIEKTDKPKYSAADWSLGSVYNSYLLPGQDENIWEETKKINDNAQKSALLGFSPDLSKLNSQIAGCKAALDEYLMVLDYGSVDVDKAYNAFIEKLHAAGSDKIIEEIQKQVDEWRKNK